MHLLSFKNQVSPNFLYFQGAKEGVNSFFEYWFWSPKLLGLVGAVVFLTVTILVFTVGKQKEDALEEVVILEEATSPVEKHEDTLVPWEIDLPQKGRWHRVLIGSFPTRKDANDFVTQKKLRNDFEVFVTQIPDS